MDTSSEVMEHSCPDKLAAINEEDLVIWVSSHFLL